MTVWLLSSVKNGISSYEIHRAISVTQKTACLCFTESVSQWQPVQLKNLFGNVEVDETFIGGEAKNMHAEKRKAIIPGRGSLGKTAVFGALERKGRVLAKVIQSTDKKTEINRF